MGELKIQMRLYTYEQEENIYLRKQAKVWQKSGFLTKEQLNKFEKLTDPNVKRTNPFFRLLLFVFTVICLSAVISFTVWLLHIEDKNTVKFILLIFSFLSYFLAEYLIKGYAFYRHGIEEALLLSAMGLFIAGISVFISDFHLSNSAEIVIVCILLSSYSGWLYLRFGFLYSLIIAAGALVAVPFNFNLSPYEERIFIFLLMNLFFYMNIRTEKPDDWDFQKENNSIFQVCLFLGVYLVCNLRLSDQNLYYSYFDGNFLKPQDFYMGFPKYFYWASYILTLIVPLCGLSYGLKKRRRPFIDMGLITAILTIMTNKDYLGFKHYSWDPAILGVILIGAAITVIKLLSKEKNKVSFGYTSENVLKPDRYGIDLISIGGAFLHTPPGTPLQGESKPFTGGESGGAGASRKF